MPSDSDDESARRPGVLSNVGQECALCGLSRRAGGRVVSLAKAGMKCSSKQASKSASSRLGLPTFQQRCTSPPHFLLGLVCAPPCCDASFACATTSVDRLRACVVARCPSLPQLCYQSTRQANALILPISCRSAAAKPYSTLVCSFSLPARSPLLCRYFRLLCLCHGLSSGLFQFWAGA